MKIAGVQKTTLIDYPEQIASIIFTQGCNLKCPYCHNPNLISKPEIKTEYLPLEQLWKFLDNRKDLIDGVCITGGEPTLQPNLEELIKDIRNYGLKIKLDTNGSRPKVLKKLIDQNLIDYIAMDIKGPLDKYNKFTDRSITDQIITSINLIKDSNLNYEFRTTVVPSLHDTDDIKKIGKLITNANYYYIQNFRSANTLDPKLQEKQGFPPAKLEEFKQIAEDYVTEVNIRN
ncbi:anaerobic ribonucleoside-triphosphate reductase activating protein [Halanaerocella petrolearia]